MPFIDTTTPNLADFITFCQGQGVTASVLPADSDYFQWGLTYAVDRVYYVCPIPSIEYCMACYNLGLHWLIENAPDTTGLVISSLAWAIGLATATTAIPLGFLTGETPLFQVVGASPIGYTGAYTATITGASTFTYPVPTNPGANTVPGLFNLTFFAELRAKWDLLSLVAGVVQSSSDQGTSASLLVPDFFKGMQMEDLDFMKTPWGRRYLSYAQKAGPTVVGIS